jgi:hypothetical protein
MSFALQTRQRFADSPEYLIPCPMCSFLDHPEIGPDIINGPDTFLSRVNRRVMVTTCCHFSEPLFAFRGGTKEEIAAAWTRMLATALAAQEAEWQALQLRPATPDIRALRSRGKLTNTLLNLKRKGFIPSSFWLPEVES